MRVAILALLVVTSLMFTRLLLAATGGGAFQPPLHLFGFVNGKVGDPPQEIYAVESVDGGLSFAVLNGGAPVIAAGGSGTWYDEYVAFPWLVFLGDPGDPGPWALWVGGYDGTRWVTGRWTSATLSADPADWTADGSNPLIIQGSSGEGDEDSAYIPRVDRDGTVERIWYTGDNDGAFSTMYAERTAGGTITKYGPVFTGSTGVFPVAFPGETRLYYQQGDDIGYLTFTDPQDAGTYTDHGIVGSMPGGPYTAGDGGAYTFAGPICFVERPGGGWLVFGTMLDPTPSTNQRELTYYSESPDGLDFSDPPVAPVVPITTPYPDNESMENPTLVVVP